MRKKKILKDIEKVIGKISDDIVRRNGGSGAEKLCGLSKLVNFYRKLVAQIRVEEDKRVEMKKSESPKGMSLNEMKQLNEKSMQNMKGVIR